MTDDLPLPDYDDLPTNAIGSRARTLEKQGVQTLLDYEEAHAARPAVVQLLTHRIDELDQGAPPTSGSPLARPRSRRDLRSTRRRTAPPRTPRSPGANCRAGGHTRSIRSGHV